MYHRFNIFQIFVIIFAASALFAQDPFSWSGEQYGFEHTNGIGWADFNDDGYQDFYFTDGNNAWPTNYNHLFLNDGDNTFTEQATTPFTADDFVSGGLTIGDFDNDGDPDIFVPEVYRVAGTPFTGYFTTYSIYENAAGSFTRPDNYGELSVETSQCGVSAAWGDYNNDGYLDLAISTQSIKFMIAKNFNAMYLNNQDGTFTQEYNNVTDNETHQGGIAWCDYDQDGDLDLVTISGREFQVSTLWTNTGTDFTGTTLTTGEDAKGASWADYDNDGDFDLFISISGVNLDAGPVAQDNMLYENVNGTLTLSSAGELTSDLLYTSAAAWGDYDNDGDLDIFIGNAGGDDGPQPSYVYVNSGGTFTKLTGTILSDSSTYTMSAAWADTDNDGDLDIAVGRQGKNRAFVNELDNGYHFLNVELTGVTANKSALGSVVKVKANINGEPTWQIREISSQTGFGGQSSMRAHFGLRDATIVDSIIINWHGSGNVDYLTNVPVDQFLNVTEGQVSAIKSVNDQILNGYSLSQNYPNPFNPVTNIDYQIIDASEVNLRVYNALGQEVQTLVNKNQTPGVYRVTFDASLLPSGVYFYKLQAGTFSEMRKMILMK